MTLPRVVIGELFDISKGRKPESQLAAWAPQARRLLQIADLRPDAIPRFTADAGGLEALSDDILIAWDGANAGTVGYGLVGYVGSTLARLRPRDPSRLFTPYVGRFLQSRFELLNNETTGATVPHVDGSRLRALRIPLPTVDEQRRIAAMLDRANAIQGGRQDVIALSQVFLASAFVELFGDPVRNPKGWREVKLGQHLTFVTSGSRGWAKYYASSGARFIRSLDVQMNHISAEEAVFVSPPIDAEAERARVEGNDVLLTITGSRIGRVSPVPSGISEAYISQHVAILRPDNLVLPEFLSMYLSLDDGGQRQIRRMQYGQTKPGLNLNQIRSFKIPLPTFAKQAEFRAVWRSYAKFEKRLIVARAESKRLFDAIAQPLFQRDLREASSAR